MILRRKQKQEGSSQGGTTNVYNVCFIYIIVNNLVLIILPPPSINNAIDATSTGNQPYTDILHPADHFRPFPYYSTPLRARLA